MAITAPHSQGNSSKPKDDKLKLTNMCMCATVIQPIDLLFFSVFISPKIKSLTEVSVAHNDT